MNVEAFYMRTGIISIYIFVVHYILGSGLSNRYSSGTLFNFNITSYMILPAVEASVAFKTTLVFPASFN